MAKAFEPIFRLFYKAINGEFQATELASAFGSSIDKLFTLIGEVLDLTEELIIEDAVKTTATLIWEMLETILPTDSNGNIIIEDAPEMLFSDEPEKFFAEMTFEVNQNTQMFKDQVRSFAPDIDARFRATTAIYDVLLSRLDSMAIDRQLSKDRCVEAMTTVFCDMIENLLPAPSRATQCSHTTHLRLRRGASGDRGSPQIEDLPFATPPTSPVTGASSIDRIHAAVGSLRSFFRGGGLKNFVQNFFDIFDVNNDGIMSKEEIKTLDEATSLLFQVRWPCLLVHGAFHMPRLHMPKTHAIARTLACLRDSVPGAGMEDPRAQGQALCRGQGVPQPNGR
jgi:hypothetical protein